MDILSSLALTTVFKAVITLIVCMIAMGIIRGIIDKLVQKAKIDDTVKNLIRTAVRVALWVLTVIIVADSLGISTASLVAVVSIAGLALSLSVQDIMSNLFSGIVILLNKTFRPGDYCDIGANSGVIQKVGLIHTQILTLDNKLVNIPNKDVAGSTITNYSSEAVRRVDMTYGCDYSDDTEVAKKALLEAASMIDKVLQDPAPFTGITAYRDSHIEFTLRAWCKTSDYWDVFFALNDNVRTTFEKYGVHMSYNHINVHMMPQ